MVKGRERTAKFYFQNEAEVLKELGLKPQPGSGNQWTHKEDGENDHLLAQLKSTDKSQYSLKLLDIEKLEHNAMVAHKIPIFLLQFLKNNSMYALIKIEDIPEVAEYLETGSIDRSAGKELVESIVEAEKKPKKRSNKKVVKSSADAREAFYKEKEAERERRRWKS